MKDYLLGIDLGSGGCKVTLLNIKESSKVITLSKEYPTYYPHPGWAEQNPEDWIAACSLNIKELISSNNLDPKKIAAIGVSGVTHSPVLLDKNGALLGNVIHLTDNRSFRQSDVLKKKANDLILEKGLNNIDAMWTIAILLWIYDNEREKWNKINKIIFPKDYLRYKLTGRILTDEIDAEGTLLFDPINKRWDELLCGLIGLDIGKLPEIYNPLDIIGEVTKEGADWSMLETGTPVIAGTTDTLLEVFVAGSIKPGDCTVKLATFGRICVITDKPFYGKGLINYSFIKKGLYYPGTGTRSFATSFRWLRDEFFKDLKNKKDAFKKMDDMAGKVKAGSSGLIFHPYLQGEGSPYVDPHLRGDFLGISLSHKREHFARAVLEGTCFSLLDCINFLKEKKIAINSPLRFIGGGTISRLWTQILADVLGRNAVIPVSTDPSIGGALMAGVATGIYKSLEEAQEIFKYSKNTIEYDYGKNKEYLKVFEIYKKSLNVLRAINHFISKV